MFTRTLALFAFGVAAVLFGATQTDAQPGRGKSPGGDVQKLERDLERLLEQVAETKAALAKAKTGSGGERQKGDGKKGFEGKKGFGDKGDFMKKKFEGFGGKGDFMKKKFEGFGGKGFKGPKGGEGAKLDPETIKQKYEYYKKLYDELPKGKGRGFEGKGKGFEGKGKGFERKKSEPMPEPKGKDFKRPEPKGFTPPTGSSRGVEARIDALMRELEALRNEIRGGKKK